jgi:hypothetical protein
MNPDSLGFQCQFRDDAKGSVNLSYFGKRPGTQAHRSGVLCALRAVRQSGTVPAGPASDVCTPFQLGRNKDRIQLANVKRD